MRRWIAATVLVLGLTAAYWHFQRSEGGGVQSNAETAASRPPLLEAARGMLAAHRQIIVLLAEEKTLSVPERAAAQQVGHALFHENLARLDRAENDLTQLLARPDAARFSELEAVLAFIESEPGLYDADRLAFRELLNDLQREISRDGSLPAVKLHKRVGEDLEALAEIERLYDREIREIFSRFDTRAIVLKREKWSDYVAHLKTLYRREQILRDHDIVLPVVTSTTTPAAPVAQSKDAKDDILFGRELPPKTLVLTFDDGPHQSHTGEIAAILGQYGLPAIFFEVGRNLGSLDPEGHIKPSPRVAAARALLADGHLLANHSLTHTKLSAQDGDTVRKEILTTDSLLKAVDAKRSNLFRFPYGAGSPEGLNTLTQASLRSMMWNIDSLDWADPIPNSIADRVLREVDAQGRGIVLFHDIHERTVKALPLVLGRLMAEGYQFATWDGTGFKLAKIATQQTPPPVVNPGYGQSWAITIGIDEYSRWPRLQHAAKDAETIGQTLVDKFGFSPERVISLKNGEATRNGILAAFHERLQHNLKPDDRVFVFFAGHGATRHLSSGRDLGYIVPVDSDPEKFASDAIPMTEIQNIAESLPARHVLFVMDACYSGLGLTRGASGFLHENARRQGRQMLTAGGADQLVADGGPNGHSIFTWTLLQGLAGRADLNGDSLITATELAAYIAPSVAGVSRQTPAFGSLPGSEGGDFVFEVRPENEFLSAQSSQLSSEAIALNSRLDTLQPKPAAAKPAPVVVTDLQGEAQKIQLPKAVPPSQRQLAQRANDRGLQLYKEKRYAEAEAAFTEALRQRPDFALAANNLGFIYFRQQKFPEAARWFENALSMDRSRAIAYLNLGDAWLKAGEPAKAKTAFQTYLEIAANGAGAGHARQMLGEI